MNIEILTESCAKITISNEECIEYGINYESFNPENISARLFLASILVRLENSGIFSQYTDKITAEIFEQENDGLIIYISGDKAAAPADNSSDSKDYSLICKSPEEIICAVKQLKQPNKSALYKLNNGYALITDCEDFRNYSNCSEIEIAKIKEYGKLLSETPYDKLYDI